MTQRSRIAFSLVETVVSTLLVSVVLVAALNTVGTAMTSRQKDVARARGILLAQDLMSEILIHEYEEPIDLPTFGREGGESDLLRSDYDDIDDFHGWSASPPQNSDGSERTDLNGWQRTISVVFTDPQDVTATSISDLGLKRVTVTVTHNGIQVGELIAVMHNDSSNE